MRRFKHFTLISWKTLLIFGINNYKKTNLKRPLGCLKRVNIMDPTEVPPWTPVEDEHMRTLFIIYKQDISTIAKIHQRSEADIKLRLVKLKIIKDNNFIMAELIEFENERARQGKCQGNGFVSLSQVLSNHISELNEKIKKLEDTIDDLKWGNFWLYNNEM